MALLLSGERPAAAAVILYPLRAVAAWIGKARAAKARRVAFLDLANLDDHRLKDLGVNRTDLFDAMDAEDGRAGRLLSDRRAARASYWLNP